MKKLNSNQIAILVAAIVSSGAILAPRLALAETGDGEAAPRSGFELEREAWEVSEIERDYRLGSVRLELDKLIEIANRPLEDEGLLPPAPPRVASRAPKRPRIFSRVRAIPPRTYSLLPAPLALPVPPRPAPPPARKPASVPPAPLPSGESAVGPGAVPKPVLRELVRVQLATKTYFSRIDSVDKGSGDSATLLSDLNLGVNGRAELRWNNLWSGSASFEYSRFRVETSAEKTFSQHDLGLFAFQFGAARQLWRNGWMEATAGAGQSPVIGSSRSEDMVTIDRAFIPQLALSLNQDFVPAHNYVVGGRAGLGILMGGQASGYSLGLGRKIELGLHACRRFNEGRIGASLYLVRQGQDSSIATQDRSDLGATIQWTWDFW